MSEKQGARLDDSPIATCNRCNDTCLVTFEGTKWPCPDSPIATYEVRPCFPDSPIATSEALDYEDDEHLQKQYEKRGG